MKKEGSSVDTEPTNRCVLLECHLLTRAASRTSDVLILARYFEQKPHKGGIITDENNHTVQLEYISVYILSFDSTAVLDDNLISSS